MYASQLPPIIVRRVVDDLLAREVGPTARTPSDYAMAFAATANDKGALPVVDRVFVVQVFGAFNVTAVLAPVAVQGSVSALRALQVVVYFIVCHLPFALEPMKGPAYNYVHAAWLCMPYALVR